MTRQSKHFQKQGDEYLCSPTGTLIIVYEAAFVTPGETRDGGKKALAVVTALTAEASRKGYPHGDILQTLIARDGITPRAVDGIERLAAALGAERVIQIIQEACQ